MSKRTACLLALAMAGVVFAGLPGPQGAAAPRSFLFDVKAGRYTGVNTINKFGRNNDIDTSTTPETIWTRGGLWVPPTAARIHSLVSTSTADDIDSGTGARSIRIFGLDENLDEQQEDLELQGQTPVQTTNSYLRIHRMVITSAGSGEVNAGTITATAETDLTVTAEIAVGQGTTQMAVWTVPRNKTAYVVTAFGSSNRQGAAAAAMVELDLVVRYGIDTATPYRIDAQTFALSVEGTSGINYQYSLPKKIVGPADIEVRASFVTDNDTIVSSGFDVVYE